MLLRLCRASVESQTLPCEHVVIPDEVGIGIAGVYAALPEHAPKASGAYVMVLSDDNILVDETFAAELRREAERADWPDAIVFKGQIADSVQPLSWGGEPQIEKIDLSCFAVRRRVWLAHAADWGHRYEGDFDFIHAVWACGHRLHWWDRLAFRALQIGRGAPEPAEMVTA